MTAHIYAVQIRAIGAGGLSVRRGVIIIGIMTL